MKFVCLLYKYDLKLTLSFNQKNPENFKQKSSAVQKLWQKNDFFKRDSQVPSGPKGLS